MLLSPEESALRLARLTAPMTAAGIDIALIQDNATKFYLTGRVFSGHIAVNCRGMMHCFVRRPNHLDGPLHTSVRKPEEIPAKAPAGLFDGCSTLGMEFSTLSVSDFNRLTAIFPDLRPIDLSSAIREARRVKTLQEISLIARSGVLQTEVYALIPGLYRPGMNDMELQIEIERQLRLKGCLGQFRISGDSMELFMGNILVGDNADSPTPYDFAMGGAGISPSLPVGANGTVIAHGDSVMVDANGNFTGYMTDMTRTFSLGTIEELAVKAHDTSIAICDAIAKAARPGTEAKSLWKIAETMAADAGLSEYFMGHTQKAGFVGHGVGIEINELPVLAPRSRDIIAEGNVIAVEPKFVIPKVGAVGIENTYIVGRDATECITRAPEPLTPLV